MARKTAPDKKNDEIASLKICMDDLDRSIAEVARQRDVYKAALQDAEAQVSGLLATVDRVGKSRKRLFREIFAREIKIARQAGYIDRVHAVERKEDVIEPSLMYDVDATRDSMVNAGSDREFDRIMDATDPEIIDQVLGRSDDLDFSRG